MDNENSKDLYVNKTYTFNFKKRNVEAMDTHIEKYGYKGQCEFIRLAIKEKLKRDKKFNSLRIHFNNKAMKKRRMEMNMSYKELAFLCGVNYNCIYNIENGNKKMNPYKSIIPKLLRALEIKHDDLFS